MNVEAISALVLDDTGMVSMTELCEQSGLSESELAMLVDSGALAPRDVRAGMPTFSASCVVVARTARRLRDDFALEDARAWCERLLESQPDHGHVAWAEALRSLLLVPGMPARDVARIVGLPGGDQDERER